MSPFVLFLSYLIIYVVVSNEVYLAVKLSTAQHSSSQYSAVLSA
jgi:hypothetical protein